MMRRKSVFATLCVLNQRAIDRLATKIWADIALRPAEVQRAVLTKLLVKAAAAHMRCDEMDPEQHHQAAGDAIGIGRFRQTR